MNITIKKLNEVRMQIFCDDRDLHEDLYYFFRYEQPNFVPSKFSKSKWDGIVRLYNKKNGTLDIGLLGDLYKFCKDRKIQIELDPRLHYMIQATKEEVMDFFLGLNMSVKTETGELVPADIRGYQFESVHTAIKASRCVLLAATSAGKSLVAYAMIRYYRQRREALESGLKTLMVVPSQHLVVQMLQDFKDYSGLNGWDAESNIHQIYDGATKETNKPIIISTWQGIQDMPADWFHQFGDILVDEVHLSAASKLSYIMNSLIYADQRLGVTGTLANTDINAIQVTAHFGKVYKIISARELIELGFAADIEIVMLTLKYPDADRLQVNGFDYQQEIDFIISHEDRNDLIVDLAVKLQGNTIIMFDRIEKHMELVYEKLKELKPNVYMNNGNIPIKIRREIQALVENGDYVTILGSFGTISTGVSIKKLHNLVLAHSSKSYIRIIQTLGRLMRMHSTKEVAKIIDLVDDLAWRGKQNATLRHSLDRYSFYLREKHPVKMFKRKITKCHGS